MVRKLFWVITNNCNLRCQYCYYNVGLEKRLNENFHIEWATSLIPNIASYFTHIVFTGGEPLLAREIYLLVETCRRFGLYTDILTNGLLLNRTNALRLIKSGINTISISLDSLIPYINDRQRDQGKKILGNIQELLKLRPSHLQIQIMMTLTRNNLNSIRPLTDFCLKNRLILRISPVDYPESRKLATFSLENLTKEEFADIEKNLYYWAKCMKNPVLKNYVANLVKFLNGKKLKNFICPMGGKHFVLDIDGGLYPCFMRKDVKIIDTHQESLKDFFNQKNKSLLPSPAEKCVRLGCICLSILGKY